jgi:PPOX class probable F420-dependent enzyme
MTAPIEQKWVELLQQRRIAAVSTLRADGTIQMSAAWYLFEDGRFLLAIPADSAKARNLRDRPSASILVDARTAGREKGVTASGTVTLLEGDAARPIIQRVQSAFVSDEALGDPLIGPVFEDFHQTALILDPQRWSHWDMEELDHVHLGGRLLAESLMRPLATEAPPLST